MNTGKEGGTIVTTGSFSLILDNYWFNANGALAPFAIKTQGGE